MIYVQAQAELGAWISHLLLSPSQGWQGFLNLSRYRAEPSQASSDFMIQLARALANVLHFVIEK